MSEESVTHTYYADSVVQKTVFFFEREGYRLFRMWKEDWEKIGSPQFVDVTVKAK